MTMNKWKCSKKQGYVSEFLSLKCAGDVLNICNPIGARAEKEITEAMAVIKVLRKIVLKKPMKYAMFDLCAGNALSSVLAVHLLPMNYAVAYDKRRRKRDWRKVDRFGYTFKDIKKNYIFFTGPCIISSIHPCGDLAEDVIRIYNASVPPKHLILIPCCKGGINGFKKQDFFWDRLSKYEIWSMYLASKIKGDYNMRIDKKCMSPCNMVITANSY